MMGAPLQRRDLRTRNVALIRVLRLMRLLRHPHSMPWLAGELQVTRRTVYRDLALLRVVGVPVYRDFGTDRWQLDLREGGYADSCE